jgi:hypothetical protein
VGKNHFEEPLYKYLAPTFGIAAPKTAGFETNSNGKPLPGKILESAAIMAVARTGTLASVRTTRPLAHPDFKNESILIAFNTFEQQDLGVGKN